MKITWRDYTVKTHGETFSLNRGDIPIMTLPATPRADGRTFAAGAWRQEDAQHLAMDVADLGTVHLAVREGFVCYWLETDRPQIDELTYFPDAAPTATRWHTFVSDELDRTFSIDDNAHVPVSSCYVGNHPDGADGSGMTDPGDNVPTWIWNIPPRVCAIDTPDGWCAMSIPGPLSVGVTRFVMHRGRFNLHFQPIRPSAREWGAARVYLVPGLDDPYDALDQHREISDACGLFVEHTGKHPDWWSYPSFKAADQIYRLNHAWVMSDGAGNQTSYLTTDNWLNWIDHVADYADLRSGMNLQIDQVYIPGYGARKTISTLGGNEGFRKTIDELRERNMRVGLYIHLYWVEPGVSDFPSQHPEALCKKKPEAEDWSLPISVDRAKAELVDWTHPAGRQFMLDQIEWLISDKPGCLNADWLLINNNRGTDPRNYDFHDPDWGIGDLMQYKALQLVYEHAKKIKPHVLVRRQSPGDTYLQPFYDQMNMCEEWNGHTRAWYQRAQVGTRLMRDCLYHVDAWWVTLSKLAEYYFTMGIFCPPEIESVTHAIHPYWTYREMREKDYRRIRAGVQTYLHAPAHRTDDVRVTYRGLDDLEIWRKRTRGPLAGWYAAKIFDRHSFVAYNETGARITASHERRVTVPMPPGANVTAVRAIPHDGEPMPYDHEATSEGIRLWIPDSSGDVMQVAIDYVLTKGD